MRIAVDVGYSNVKAVSDSDCKIIFPSVVAPVKENPINGIGGFKTKHYYAKINNKESLTGDAAVRSLTGVSTLNREKPPEIHDLFILVASYLCGAGILNPTQKKDIHLAVGLPLAYYRSQKDDLKQRLLRLSATVSVDNGEAKYISFQNITVLPQGLGILFAEDNLPDQGYIGLIDIGCFTTDYMLFAMEDGYPVLIPDGCGSVEAGTYLVQQDLAAAFQSQTGAPLAHFMYADALKLAMNNEPIYFQGKEINLSGIYKQSCKETTQLILEAIRSVWVSRGEYLNSTIFAGGGSKMFENYLQKSFPATSIIDDPIFANSQGFLKLIS